MADLTIRNLTATPLELKVVERFEGHPVSSKGTSQGNFTSRITGIFNSSSVAPHVQPQGDVRDRKEVMIPIGKFETRETDIRAADPGREVLRLTFESDGHRYQIDAPSSSPRCSVAKKLDDGPNEYTCVYVQSGSCLAIFSSAHLSSWMNQLHSDYPLTALSIPGTHNSPTCHVALPSVRCQAVNVREQLDNGVRFFDIRVSVNIDNSDLSLVHSAFPISLTGNKYFHDMLKDVYAFLDANKSETLIMSVKREGTGRGTDHHLSKYLKERYCNDGTKWFTKSYIPKLGEVRGKIVLLRRYANDPVLDGENGGTGFGLDCSQWPDNCADEMTGSGIARVQDFYDVDQSHNVQKKIDLVRGHLERAGEPVYNHRDAPPEYKPFFVNFLTASNFFNANCWPEKIAAKVNPAIIEYLCLRHGAIGKGPAGLAIGDARTGIVVTDWVGQGGDWDLIRCVVGWNAKLQLKAVVCLR
ncbi:phosphatidylinositol-specific phospholipase C [Pseudomassariella vexata]|uniref:Phosphatidylinositol-specific phospholipase C n=1 Tax=Pseudomassariella vexata TaxID=1141098 RepID=A0A1Y2E4D3_9PEZI|nr:phosphatidylinositol-specific phospholipase C [Pseudomassariella vexata]ORY66297.1 phosphatidylinositol-specific phospholipase C [Pseudomassariella vexata]